MMQALSDYKTSTAAVAASQFVSTFLFEPRSDTSVLWYATAALPALAFHALDDEILKLKSGTLGGVIEPLVHKFAINDKTVVNVGEYAAALSGALFTASRTGSLLYSSIGAVLSAAAWRATAKAPTEEKK